MRAVTSNNEDSTIKSMRIPHGMQKTMWVQKLSGHFAIKNIGNQPSKMGIWHDVNRFDMILIWLSQKWILHWWMTMNNYHLVASENWTNVYMWCAKPLLTRESQLQHHAHTQRSRTLSGPRSRGTKKWRRLRRVDAMVSLDIFKSQQCVSAVSW